MFWGGRRKANIWFLNFFFKLNPQLLFCLLKLFSIKINWNKTPSWCFEEEEEHNDVEHDDENTICIKCTVFWY